MYDLTSTNDIESYVGILKTKLENISHQLNKKNAQLEHGRECILDLIEEDLIDTDAAEKIAEAFGIDLKSNKKFTVTAEFTIEIELTPGQEVDIDDFDSELTYTGKGELISERCEITEVSED